MSKKNIYYPRYSPTTFLKYYTSLYITKLYPNEENIPQINKVVDYEVNKERCKVELEVILFNSQKEIVTIILNSNTGDIIAPNQITQ